MSKSNYDASQAPQHATKSGKSISYFDRIMQFALWLHDEYYYFIQRICTPLCEMIPRTYGTYDLFTANSITYARTFLTLVIVYCMRFQYNALAAFLVMYHDFLDHVDGVVAKVQRENGSGKDDDGVWGAFIDAFCDKIVFCTCLWSILLLLPYERMPLLLNVTLALISLILIGYEIGIGIVRLNDYYHVALAPKGKGPPRALRAVMEGKLKQKLESIGVALLAVILPLPSSYPVTCILSICSLIGGIYFAHCSLLHKLQSYPHLAKWLPAHTIAPPE